MSKRERAALARTDTIALSPGGSDDEPPTKRTKAGKKRGQIAYSTTTVLRSLDEAGTTPAVSLVHSLRSASIHTRAILQQQLDKQKPPSDEELLARRVLSVLNKHFKEVAKYAYEPGAHSHEWSTKAALGDFEKELSTLTKYASALFQKDDMIVRLKSPCYVLGDLHGNYKDLMFFKKSFWGMGVDMSPARFLFLGDYVDRGPHSVELIAYLFAMKILNPEKVFLLRGNHEFASQNGERDYDPCFLQNCEELFAKKKAERIWKAFNAAFDWMPLVATIDRKIFCCHGGIPRLVENDLGKETKLMELIGDIERPLLEDVMESSEDFLALDILWSDPATEEEEEDSKGWFAENSRGGDIVVYGKNAVDAFVAKTGCTHIIRAHQPPSRGIEYCKAARILTVFSSSHYCGGFNSAAIVLVSDNRIRMASTGLSGQDDEEASDDDEMVPDDVIAEEDYEEE